ncbi:MAG: hypothetical protein ACLFV6_13820 [Spirulinaceae cyanobacterium]
MQLFSKTTTRMAALGFLAIASPLAIANVPPILKAATAQTQPADMNLEDWETFVSEAGRFSAAFPDTPTENIQEGNVAADAGASGEIMLENTDENSGYVVFYQDFPMVPDGVPDEQVQTILAASRDGFVQDNEILSERDIELDGHRGKEVEVQMPEGYMKARMYWVDSRLYFVVGGAPTKDDAIAQETDRFLDSFMLLE